MNRELVEILIGIYQIDKNSKTILCNKASKCTLSMSCNVCPLGYIQFIYEGNIHYLKHLIALMDRGNI